jgi:hypothetical protein
MKALIVLIFAFKTLAILLALSLGISSSDYKLAADSHLTGVVAHPVGAPANIIIEFGEQYLGAELYDAKITVLEIVRGEKARDAVKHASSANPPPEPRFDYLLARVRFEFSARTSPAPDNYHLNETQFTATDPQGREFASPELNQYPQPPLRGTLKPGDRLEGWLVLLVPQNAVRPLMIFREDVGEVSHRGSGTWFELYKRPPAKAHAER